jgi:D-glycero-D-manno-heptose 1,7-bisphosphate phosphatase
VFLDRDGVLNRCIVRNGRPYPPDTLDSFEILPEVPGALDRLKRAGFLLIVATNQPDVASGKQRLEVVEAMHRRLLNELPIDDIKVCLELDSDACQCYKPKPGMLLSAAQQFGIDLPGSFMIGDRWRDVGAGRAAGCKTIFIERGYIERRPEAPDAVVADIAEAADVILSQSAVGRVGGSCFRASTN